MRYVNVGQLETVLRNVRGSTAVSLIARTDARLLLRRNPFAGLVWKVAHVNGMIGFRYKNSFDRQRLREDKRPEAEAESRIWGTRDMFSPIIRHGDALYLEIKVETVHRVEYRHKETNALIPAATLRPWIPKRQASRRQQLSREIRLKDYALESIEQLTMRGTVYVAESTRPRPRRPPRKAA